MGVVNKKKYRIGGIALSTLFMLFSCFSLTPAQETVSLMTNYLDTGGVGAYRAEGLTFVPSTCSFAFVDGDADKVFITDALGVLENEFDLTYSDNPYPRGIAYVPSTEHFAILDATLDTVFLVDHSGVLQGQFNISGQSTSPAGITYDENTGNFAVVDSSKDKVFTYTVSGAWQAEFALLYSSPNPEGITFIPSTGNFAILDESLEDIVIVNSSGVLQKQCDIGFVSPSATGVTYDFCNENFAVVDSSLDEVFSINCDGTISDQFGLSPVGSSAPSGITFIPTEESYAIVDAADDKIIFINTAGEKQGECDLPAFAESPSGVSYISAGKFAGNLAVVNEDEKLFIATSECSLLAEYDLSTFGISSSASTGVVYRPTTNSFVVADSTRDTALFVKLSRPGRLSGQMSTSAFVCGNPQGVTWISAGENFAYVDSTADEVFIVDARGILRGRFDTAGFVSRNPRGIAFDSVNQKIAVLDKSDAKVTIIDLPGLLDHLATPTCKCDTNNDCDVDGEDLSEFAMEFGRDDCL